MKWFQKILMADLLILILLMGGCQESVQYDYLMQHPNQLQQAYDKCRFDASNRCDQVRHAMQDFNEFVNQQIIGPDQFGERIMSLQQQLVTLSHERIEAEKAGDQAKLTLINQAYQDALRQLRVYYAVVKKNIID